MENKSRRDEKCAKQAERINCSWQHAGGADYWDDYVPRGFKRGPASGKRIYIPTNSAFHNTL